MDTFVALALLIVICCALVIFVGTSLRSLRSQLKDINYVATRINATVSKIYTEQPYHSWFTSSAEKLNKKLDDINDHLTTEIACLATKNNEDIKRMGGKFEEWDLIELDENEVLIYSAKPNANGQMVFHCVDKAGKMYTFFGSDKLNDAQFLRHTSSPFGEREV